MPNIPQQSGVAERMDRTIMEKAQIMMHIERCFELMVGRGDQYGSILEQLDNK